MTIDSVPLWEENAGAVHHAKQYRRLLESLLQRGARPASSGTNGGGIMHPSDFAVTQRGAGANMSVDVAAGQCIVDGHDTGTLLGSWYATNDATVNTVIAAADPSNGRYDLIGVQIRDTEYSGASNDSRIVVVQGTPAASPAEPSLASYPNFYTLARVTVGAGVTSITNANILDRRRMLSAIGGELICSSSNRPTTPYEGMAIYETDTDRHYCYDGSAWRYVYGGTQPLYAARMYRNSAYSNLGAATTTLQLPFDTVDYDYNSNLTTGASAKYTVPVTGLCQVQASHSLTSATGSGDTFYLSVYKGGSEARRLGAAGITVNGYPFTLTGTATIACSASDQLDIRVTHAAGATAMTQQSGSALSFAEFRML